MNNTITTNETMPKMADATRLRTCQLLRFSQGSSTIVFSIILLCLGFNYYMANICGGGQLLRTVSLTLTTILFIVAGFMILETATRKRKSLYAEVYRGSILILQRVIIIMFVLLVGGASLLEIWSPWLSNRIFPGMIFFGILGLTDFRNFILTRLPEDLASSIAILGLSLTNIGWPLGNYIWLYLFLWGLIGLLQGVILYIRWQQSTKRISNGNREEKAT